MEFRLRHKIVRTAITLVSVLALTSRRSRDDFDVYLNRIFSENPGIFTRILAMLSEDHHVLRIDYDFVTVDGGAFWKQGDPRFSQQRWEEYRALFRKIRLQYGVGREYGDPSTIFFYAKCSGTAITRDCKGYAYSEKALAPTKDNLDRLAPGMAFKPLSANWYLFRDGG